MTSPPSETTEQERYVGTYACEDCGLTVRLSTLFKLGTCDHDCRRCGEETRHSLTEEPVPESEVKDYLQ